MIRTIYVVLIAVPVTIVYASITLVVSLIRPGARLAEAAIRAWAGALVRAAGIDLSIEHEDRLDWNSNYIYVANHTSYFDIPVLQSGLRQPIRFLAKKSLFQIPLFGSALKAAGFIPIDRKNRRTAVQSFDQAAERIRRGKSIVVFPEEGRSSSREMKPFQRGAFLLAIKSGVPLVPIAIRGTFELLAVGSRKVRPGPVRIIIGEPIDVSEYSVRQKEALANETRSRIEAMLGAAPAERD
ncbi:MAG: lysophospholipid acyltransferase family protein [Acidobacteriota bacterium]